MLVYIETDDLSYMKLQKTLFDAVVKYYSENKVKQRDENGAWVEAYAGNFYSETTTFDKHSILDITNLDIRVTFLIQDDFECKVNGRYVDDGFMIGFDVIEGLQSLIIGALQEQYKGTFYFLDFNNSTIGKVVDFVV